MNFSNVKRVLICRMGSIGDTIVSLPCFHLINKTFPDAQKILLTNNVENKSSVSSYAILKPAGLIDGYITFPKKPLTTKTLLKLMIDIRNFNPDVVVYLELPKSFFKIWRDALFFKLCCLPNIPKLIGFKYLPVLGLTNKFDKNTGLYEYEGRRLLRYINRIGYVDLDDKANWDLNFSKEEQEQTANLLAKFTGRKYIVFSIGTKIPMVNDWGEHKWKILLDKVTKRYPNLGILLIGAKNEAEKHASIVKNWLGPIINLCGMIGPREAALLSRNALFFIGHDSGPMHLCASQNVCCICVFGMRNFPGVWFPYGSQHKIIYHDIACRGCGLSKCKKFNAKCIKSITEAEVEHAINNLIENVKM